MRLTGAGTWAAFRRCGLYVCAAAFFGSSVNAGMINLDDVGYLDPPGASGISSNPTKAQILDTIQGNDTTPDSLYEMLTDNFDIGEQLFKWNMDGSPGDGSLLSSYSVTVTATDDDDETIGLSINFLGGMAADTDAPTGTWLVVKDGETGWVVYDLNSSGIVDDGDGNDVSALAPGDFSAGWDGLMQLKVSNLGLDGKAISHVEIWGTKGDITFPPQEIPEPTSLVLLGLGFAGLGGRRLLRRKSA